MTFFEWFDGYVAQVSATDYGKAFLAAGFYVQHTGGGCTAWQMDLANGVALFCAQDATADNVDGMPWGFGLVDVEGYGLDFPETRIDYATPTDCLNAAIAFVATIESRDFEKVERL